MVKKRKKLFVSLLTGASIMVSMTSYCACRIARDGYISTVYGINKESIVDDFELAALEKGITHGDEFLFTKYAPFSSRIDNLDIKTPIHDDMVPQGLTIMNDYVLTTSYDHSGLNNSMVYVLDKSGNLVNSCVLDVDSHVGGIAYDKKNNLVWIPAHSGKLNAYRTSDFLDKKEVKACYSNLDVGSGLLNYKNPWKNSIAFLTIDEDDLYVGSFSVTSSGLVKRYSISVDEDKSIKLTYKRSFYVPTRVQGMTFYKKDSNKYIILSRSFGKATSSLLQVFSYDEEIMCYNSSIPSVSYIAPSMMEQVSLDGEDLYVIFESAAKPYRGCYDEFDDICVMDVDDVVSPIAKKRY